MYATKMERTMSKSIYFGVRMPEDLAKKIKQLAKNERRGVSPAIVWIVDRYFKSKGE